MRHQDEELRSALDGVSDVIRELRMSSAPPGTTSNVMINGGGIGVWIATVCCALMLGMATIGTMIILDQSRQISDLRDYLSAIYAQAPSLRPEEDKDKGK